MPVVTRIDDLATLYNNSITNSGGTLFETAPTIRLTGRGFIEGATTVFLATRVDDIWNPSGPSIFTSDVANGGLELVLPTRCRAGRLPFARWAAPRLRRTPSAASTGRLANKGTPAVLTSPSANARQTIALVGSGFTLQTEIVFVTQPTLGPGIPGLADTRATRVVTPASVSADGTRMTVVVPDDAATGEVVVVGSAASFFLQIVPTIENIVLPVSFATGQTLTMQGSGYIEGDVSIGVGGSELIDNGAFHGPDVVNATLTGAGLTAATTTASTWPSRPARSSRQRRDTSSAPAAVSRDGVDLTSAPSSARSASRETWAPARRRRTSRRRRWMAGWTSI